MFGTIFKRRERHLYSYLVLHATFITAAVLHVVNPFELPVSLSCYSLYWCSRCFVQWYGLNAVAFSLGQTPFWD